MRKALIFFLVTLLICACNRRIRPERSALQKRANVLLKYDSPYKPSEETRQAIFRKAHVLPKDIVPGDSLYLSEYQTRVWSIDVSDTVEACVIDSAYYSADNRVIVFSNAKRIFKLFCFDDDWAGMAVEGDVTIFLGRRGLEPAERLANVMNHDGFYISDTFDGVISLEQRAKDGTGVLHPRGYQIRFTRMQ